MQDNLVNPQSINDVIQTVYGSYEQFVTNMIQRRKELEIEKTELLKRLKEIEKEESLIKSILTGKRSENKLTEPSTLQGPNSTGLLNRLEQINKEDELIKKALTGFHGNRIAGQYFDAESFSLVQDKPQKLQNLKSDSSSQDIADYLILKKDEINHKSGKVLIDEKKLFSSHKFESENSLSPSPLTSYKQQICNLLKSDYLNEDFKTQELNEEIVKEKFNKGISAKSFVSELAKELKLKPVKKNGVKV